MVFSNYRYTTRDIGTFLLIENGRARLCYGGVLSCYLDVELFDLQGGGFGAALEGKPQYPFHVIEDKKAKGALVYPVENWGFVQVMTRAFLKRTEEEESKHGDR